MSFAKLSRRIKPYSKLQKLVELLNTNQGKFLELGGGSLVESSYLLDKGFEVHVVDKDIESKKKQKN